MRVLGKNKIIPDNQVLFYDGFIHIIEKKTIRLGNNTIEKEEYTQIILDAEYNTPISLADIARVFPDVRKVIYDDAFDGCVYNYRNHIDTENEAWEQVGTTLGYA